MSEPRDQELEDYLAGKSEISRLYRQAPAELPSPELDAQICAAARIGLTPRRPRWMMPLSAAAVLMLSVGVLLRMQQEGVTPVPVEKTATQADPGGTVPSEPAPAASHIESPAPEMRSRESQGAVAEPFPAPAAASAPAQRKAQPQSADEALSAPSRDETEALTPAPATGDAARAERSEQVREPEDWIELIRHLRAEGRDTEATAELRAFRERYPDYALPEDLRANGND